MNEILRVENLKVKRGGVPVLDIAALNLREGEVLSLIGPNGTGKSSLLLTLAGLLKPEAGNIFFRNEPLTVKDILAYRRRIAMVFQEPLLLNTTVYDNVASGLKIRGIGSAEINRRVTYCLERFGVQNLVSRSARKLSGGEAQRTSLARAFAVEPEILFLDEPFSALDPPTREALTEDFVNILRETKLSAVMATHDLTEALRISGKLAVMDRGKIVQMGTGEDIIERPSNRFVASFVKVETLLPGKIVGGDGRQLEINVAGKRIKALSDQTMDTNVLCCIRPERVALFRETGSASGYDNAFLGRIEKIEVLGFYYRILLDCGFPLVAYITKQTRESLQLEKDEMIGTGFDAASVHIIGEAA